MKKSANNHRTFILPDPQATQMASENDRVWFEQNPNASDRIRPPFPNEWVFKDVVCTEVHVTQVKPGERFRAAVVVPVRASRDQTLPIQNKR